MIELIKRDKLQWLWILLHAALGYLSSINKWLAIVWFYSLAASFILGMLSRKTPIRHNILFFLAYTLGFEILGRGVEAQPYLPDQLGKYIGIVLLSLGLLWGGPVKKTSWFGMIMLVLCIPAIVFSAGTPFRAIVFNFFGLLTLIVGVLYCSRQIMTFTDYKLLVRFILYPILTLAVFTFARSSVLTEVRYTVAASYESGGGSITNQVSTLLGCGIAIMLYAILSRQTIFYKKFFDYAVLLVLVTRGLLTFSRGGMVTAVIVILLIIIFPKAKAAWQDTEVRLRKFKLSYVLVSGFLLVGSFFLINRYTNNFLLYRYQAKTQRSLETGFDKEKNLDDLTTGRYSIFISDLKMFSHNTLAGVGIGQSTTQRQNYGGPEGVLPHIELSRLLAEQGVFGFFLVILMYIIPYYKTYREPNNYRKGIMLLFFTLALLSTFHSAMRTMVSPLLFAFACVKFIPTNYDWQTALGIGKGGTDSPKAV